MLLGRLVRISFGSVVLLDMEMLGIGGTFQTPPRWDHVMRRSLLEGQGSTARKSLAAGRRVVLSDGLLYLDSQVPNELVALVPGLM